MKKILFIILFFFNSSLFAGNFDFLAQFEGACMGVAVYGDYAYFNTGGNINILNISNPDSIVYIGQFRYRNSSLGDIIIQNSYMYITSSGVFIYDLSDLEHPVLVSKISSYYGMKTIISDTILILNCYGESELYNISDIENPLFLSLIFFDFDENAAYCLNNNVLYGFHQEGYSGGQYLDGFDISNPSSPQQVAQFELSPDYHGDWPECMESFDDKIFVAFNNTIKVYDISETDTIIYLTQFDVEGKITKLQIIDDTLYASIENYGISILDISNLDNPVVIGSYEEAKYISKFRINGNYIYTALGTSGFKIADKTNILNIIQKYSFHKADAVSSLKIKNNLAFMGQSADGLQIIDISDFLEPVDLGKVDFLKGIENMELYKNYLYCKTLNDTIIHIVNIVDSLNPLKVGEIVSSGYISSYCIDGDHLFLLEDWNQIRVFDLSTPESPVETATFNENGTQIAVNGSLLLMSDIVGEWPSNRIIKAYEMVNFSQLNFKSQISLGDISQYDCRKIEITESGVYICVSLGLVVATIDSTYSLSICDQYMVDESLFSMYVDGNLIYLPLQSGTIIINAADNYNLSAFGYISGYNYDFARFGNILYTAKGGNGYAIYQINGTGILGNEKNSFNFNLNNYPNPFKNNTEIRFNIPKNQQALLEIYSLSGKKMEAFNVTNKDHFELKTEQYPAGVYIYRITTKYNSATSKMIILK